MDWKFPWSSGPPLPAQGPGDRRRQGDRRGDRRSERRRASDPPPDGLDRSADSAPESEQRRQDRRSGRDQREHPRQALVGAALNVTVLILHEGRRLKPGSIWDLSYGGACVWVPEPLELDTGATVELQLITAQDANSIQLEATLCWTKTCDGQWFVGFRFAPPGLPADCSLYRLLERNRATAQRRADA